MRVHTFPTPKEVGQQAADYVAGLAEQAILRRGRFTVALSGGSLMDMIAPPLRRRQEEVKWSAWHLFWADERCVPLSHPESNYRLARRTLFDYVDIPLSQIYPIDDSLTPSTAALVYQATLEQVFSGPWPRFDLILLGMGPDGHTASLFPGHPLLQEQKRWVAHLTDSPKPPPERITLTLPVINRARQVAFVVVGQNKAEALARVRQGDSALPASLVQPLDGELHWFVDKAALY